MLLVIDTQKLITNKKLYQFDLFVSNIKNLIYTARKNNIEVIYVRHDDGCFTKLTKGTAEYEIYDEFKPIDNEKIFDKNVNSPFKETGLLAYLKEKDIKKLIITGLQTDFCIDATIKCAFEHGFQVIVPEFTNSTIDNQFLSGKASYEYYNQFIWHNRYAKCISMKETIREMEDYGGKICQS